MGKRGEIVRELKHMMDPRIAKRDGYACAICGSSKLLDVHEILSKSKFSTNDLDVCIAPRNMILVCREHHNIVQGNPRLSGFLLRLLRDRFGYEYEDRPFSWYVENEIETEEDLGWLKKGER